MILQPFWLYYWIFCLTSLYKNFEVSLGFKKMFFTIDVLETRKQIAVLYLQQDIRILFYVVKYVFIKV